MSRRDLAGVTVLTLHPETATYASRRVFETPGKAAPLPRLTYVRIDVGHIFTPSEFVHYIHEAGHLIYDVLGINLHQRAELTVGVREGTPPRLVRDRLEEVFVGFLTHLFVFDVDWSLYARHQLSTYSLMPVSNPADLDDAKVKFAEVMLRTFVIVDAIRGSMALKDVRDSPSQWPLEYPYGEESASINGFAGRFVEFVEEYGPYCANYDSITRGTPRFAEFCKSLAVRVMREFGRGFAAAYCESLKTYQAYMGELREKKGIGSGEKQKLRKEVENGMRNGAPMIADRFFLRCRDGDSSAYVDDLMLVGELLHEYIALLFRPLKLGTKFHVQRDLYEEFSGVVEYPGGRSMWHPFQLDRSVGGVRCAVPSLRRERLKRGIVVMKALWGISTKLASRRLGDIVDVGREATT